MTAVPFRGGSIGDALRHRILADRTLRRTPVLGTIGGALLPYPGHKVFCTDVCWREAGRLRLEVKLMYLNDSSRVKMRVPDSQTAGPRQSPWPGRITGTAGRP